MPEVFSWGNWEPRASGTGCTAVVTLAPQHPFALRDATAGGT